MVSKFGGPVFVVLNTTPPSACKISTVNHTVTVCRPSDGAVGLSPAHIVSHFTSSTPPSVSQIYLDNKLVFQVAGGSIDKNLPLAPGEHRLEVKSWTKGQPFHNDFFLSTPRSIPATVPPCSESSKLRSKHLLSRTKSGSGCAGPRGGRGQVHCTYYNHANLS